jgi:two-component system sensor histidine kinase VanS
MRVREIYFTNCTDMEKILKVIHDINTPLSTVLGYSELLEKRDLPEKEKEWIKKIHSESLRIKDLMKDLSDAVSEASD